MKGHISLVKLEDSHLWGPMSLGGGLPQAKEPSAHRPPHLSLQCPEVQGSCVPLPLPPRSPSAQSAPCPPKCKLYSPKLWPMREKCFHSKAENTRSQVWMGPASLPPPSCSPCAQDIFLSIWGAPLRKLEGFQLPYKGWDPQKDESSSWQPSPNFPKSPMNSGRTQARPQVAPRPTLFPDYHTPLQQ